MNTNRDINSEVQSLENGSTGNVRMEVEAPAVDNILTIDDSPDTNAEYAPADRQEKDSNTAPIKETKAQSNRTWWNPWSGAQEQKDLEIVPTQGECLEEVMLAQEAKEDIPDDNHQPEEESETQSGARVDNLEKMVKQLSASLEVTNQTALGADMNKHTKDFLKTEIDAQMAKATGRITETKQGMENNKQQIENIAQELTAKTSNFVTNQRVAKLETEINDNLVKKISNLEKEIAKKINTVTKEEMENKFAGIAKEVGGVPTLEKSVSKLEEEVANDTKSIIKKITEIEENLQGIDKLGTEFKHLGDMVTQLKNTSICNTYMLHGITFSVKQTQYIHDYKQFKQQFQKLRYIISNREEEILNKHQNHWREALTLF